MVSSVNMIWILFGTALVFFMQAGFAMVEAGFTRAKNAGNIIMKNLLDLSIGTPLYWFLGFGIMYGGGIDFFIHGDYGAVLPEGVSLWAFVVFQTVFCATSATIVSGAMAERTKFSAYCIYSAVISLLIYPVSGHWIWGGGFLQQMGFHDFAGSAAVHMVGGVAAFVGAKILGPRIGKYGADGKAKAIPGHNITIGALGVFILWFCWFGFNGGSTVSMEPEAAQTAGLIFMNTNLAAATATVTTMLFTWVRYKKPDVSMTLNGALAGLVAVTAGCDLISPVGAALIGAAAGLVVTLAVEFVDTRLKIDDPVGAIGVHGFCGALGTVLTGLFATQDGLFYGGGIRFLGVQALGAAVIIVWVGITAWMTFWIVDKTVGLRVSRREELEGLDSAEHGLSNAYADFLPSAQPDNMAAPVLTVLGVATRDIPVEEAIPINMPEVCGDSYCQTVLTKVEIICKQSKFEELKTAMNDIGVTGMTVTQVLGCGIQKGATEYYRGVAVDVQLLPKMRVEIVVARVPVTDVVSAARRVLYTGHIGDGKIFIYDVRDAVKVRTGETGYNAMQGLDII